MRSLWSLTTLGLALALLAVVPVMAEVPDLIESGQAGRSEPVWRSAAALETEQGIRWELFNAYEREELRSRLGAQKELEGNQSSASKQGTPPCVVYGPVVTEATTFHSLEESISRSAAIYSGTVVGSKEGFLYNHPGTLYEVAVGESLMPGAVPAQLFVYYPDSGFRLGGQRICKRGLRFPERPKVGSGILVFSLDRATGGQAVLHPSDSGLFFEAENGGLSVPPSLDSLEGIRELPLSEIVDQVREELDRLELDVESPRVPRLLDQLEGGRP